MTVFRNVMVDLETTGMDARSAGILSIAAIPFNINGVTIDTSKNAFYEVCNPFTLFNRRWDHRTLNWHMDTDTGLVDPETTDPIEKDQPVQHTLLNFTEFVANECVTSVKFWSRPAHFDYPIVASHLEQCEHNEEFRNDSVYTPPMFHYRNVRDVATFCETMNPVFDPKGVPFAGKKHNALDDVRYNISCMMNAMASRIGVGAAE